MNEHENPEALEAVAPEAPVDLSDLDAATEPHTEEAESAEVSEDNEAV